MWLAGAFAVEKLVYVLAWLNWLLNNDLSTVYSKYFLEDAFIRYTG